MNRKILINVAFIGNEDSGKSTTIVHFFIVLEILTKIYL